MNKVVYKQGNFIDYKGTKVNFIMAAVSISTNYVLIPVDELGFEAEGEQLESKKILSIGLAICQSGDTWNEELGKKIAYGKAMKRRDHIAVVTDEGMINTQSVEALLEQEVQYLAVNPGRYIAGYDESKKKYLSTKAKEEYYNSLTDEEKTAIKIVAQIKEPRKFLEAVEGYRSSVASNLL